MTAHPIDTEALRRLADAASPLPWGLDIENEGDYEQGIPFTDYPGAITGPRSITHWDDPVWQERFGTTISEVAEMNLADAEYMVSAANAVPALLDALAAAEHRATRAEARIKAVRALATQEDEDGDWVVTRDAVLRALGE